MWKINTCFKDTDKPHMESWDGFEDKSLWSHCGIYGSCHTMQQSGYNHTQCRHQLATQFIKKISFCHIWLLYKEVHTQNLSSKQFCEYTALILLCHLTCNSFRPNWKDTLRKMKFCIGKEKGKWRGEESHWVVLISKIDGFRFLFVFADKRQQAVAGLACSSEKWSRVSRLPILPKVLSPKPAIFSQSNVFYAHWTILYLR